jgi:hypothetical protein
MFNLNKFKYQYFFEQCIVIIVCYPESHIHMSSNKMPARQSSLAIVTNSKLSFRQDQQKNSTAGEKIYP